MPIVLLRSKTKTLQPRQTTPAKPPYCGTPTRELLLVAFLYLVDKRGYLESLLFAGIIMATASLRSIIKLLKITK